MPIFGQNNRDKNAQPPGNTADFVVARGIVRFDEANLDGLLAADGTIRFIGLLLADSDRPEINIDQAMKSVLSALPPGGAIRFMQTVFLSPVQRMEFYQSFLAYPSCDGPLAVLRDAFDEFLRSYPLPYSRKTYIEYIHAGSPEQISWWLGITGLLEPFGLRLIPLSADDLVELVRVVTNPNIYGGYSPDVSR